MELWDAYDRELNKPDGVLPVGYFFIFSLDKPYPYRYNIPIPHMV